LSDCKAIGFDLDGTLYAEWKMHIRAVPGLFFRAWPWRYSGFYSMARARIRMEQASGLWDEGNPLRPEGGFYAVQARYMAEAARNYSQGHALGRLLRQKAPEDAEAIEQRVDISINKGYAAYFTHIRPFKGIPELLADLKDRGYRLGLLSDWQPPEKLRLMGLDRYFDAVLCTEEIGFLKPHPRPFHTLCEALGSRPEETVYIGNSRKKDLVGAKNAGLRAFLIQDFLKQGSVVYRKFIQEVL
jgi:putative hydrolase of the HAD superfamily